MQENCQRSAYSPRTPEFVRRGHGGIRVDADTDTCVKTLLTIVVKPHWIDSVANGGRSYVFQRDSAPSQKALETPEWMDSREFSSSCHTELKTSQLLIRP
ncbi:unnamed protein product [Hymenolepis diminuta]|uniref:Uncharacterized protein n=1 Tax=Hymenolepis diminuta TaxID=6216 RepID=A0A564Y280_HYMDI|nr:unnamed protein product [Hymenolepis diminuta]